MSAVERVTYRHPENGKSQTVLLEGVREMRFMGEPAITGMEVDRDGVLVAPSAAYLRAHNVDDGTVRHVILVESVMKRTPMVQDLFYGGLKPAKEGAS